MHILFFASEKNNNQIILGKMWLCLNGCSQGLSQVSKRLKY